MAAALTRLLITRRRIPLDQSDEYAGLWRAVQRTAEGHGARAWIFASDDAGDRFIEFIEWRTADDVTALTDVAAAIDALDAAFAAEDSGTWTEAKI